MNYKGYRIDPCAYMASKKYVIRKIGTPYWEESLCAQTNSIKAAKAVINELILLERCCEEHDHDILGNLK